MSNRVHRLMLHSRDVSWRDLSICALCSRPAACSISSIERCKRRVNLRLKLIQWIVPSSNPRLTGFVIVAGLRFATRSLSCANSSGESILVTGVFVSTTSSLKSSAHVWPFPNRIAPKRILTASLGTSRTTEYCFQSVSLRNERFHLLSNPTSRRSLSTLSHRPARFASAVLIHPVNRKRLPRYSAAEMICSRYPALS